MSQALCLTNPLQWPRDVLRLCLSFLPFSFRWKLRVLNTEFHGMALDSITSIDIQDYNSVTDEVLCCLLNHFGETIETIALGHNPITPLGIQAVISHGKQLKAFGVERNNALTDEALVEFLRHVGPQLTQLTLDW